MEKLSKIIKNNIVMLKESSLSRIYQHIQEHETAIITASRDKLINCVYSNETPTNNKDRNKDLKALLLKKRYGVTSIDGSFIENFEQPNAVEVKENSFFVVNLNDDSNFNRNIVEFGKIFCQDSVLLIPQEGKGAYLYGTNNDTFVGLDNNKTIGNLNMGNTSMFMSKINNRPFVFETINNYNNNTRSVIEKINLKYGY